MKDIYILSEWDRLSGGEEKDTRWFLSREAALKHMKNLQKLSTVSQLIKLRRSYDVWDSKTYKYTLRVEDITD